MEDDTQANLQATTTSSGWSWAGFWEFLDACFSCGDVQSRLEGDIETIKDYLEGEGDLNDVWNRFDADKGGEIDHAEFDRVLFACFRYFTGKMDPEEAPLSRTELQPFIETLNSDLHKMIDPNGDGVLSFEEFQEFGKYLTAEYQKLNEYLHLTQPDNGRDMRKTQIQKDFERNVKLAIAEEKKQLGSAGESTDLSSKLKSRESGTLSTTDVTVNTETKSEKDFPASGGFTKVSSASQLTPVTGNSDGYRRMESQSVQSDPVMPKMAVHVGQAIQLSELVFTGKQTGVNVEDLDGDGAGTPEALTAAEKEAKRAAMMGKAGLVPSVESFVSTASTLESAETGTSSADAVHPPPAIDEEPETLDHHQFSEEDDDSDSALNAMIDEAANDMATDHEMSPSPKSRDL